jgi:hypothetical protein
MLSVRSQPLLLSIGAAKCRSAGGQEQQVDSHPAGCAFWAQKLTVERYRRFLLLLDNLCLIYAILLSKHTSEGHERR